jgi:biopolymer transport protein ExbD|tara:strand:+ start:396 stop:887 length:492 start_codon:yes stop_codon:yes gene_type:complete
VSNEDEMIEEQVSFGGKLREEDELDMTPMVDVTFLLLIFFVMTAAFTIQTSLPIPTPQSEEASTNAVPEDTEEDPEFITVKVDADNNFWVTGMNGLDEECPDVKALRTQLRLMKDDMGEVNKVVVEANEESLHAQVVAAIDAGMVIGVDQVQLMTVAEDNINY